MYEDIKVKRKIDWNSLFVKGGVLLVGVFLVCLVIFSPKGKSFADTPINEKTRLLLNAGIEHYENNALPTVMGSSNEITLMALIEKKQLNAKDFNSLNCDFNDSSIKITRVGKNDYSIKAYLLCGKDNNTIVNSIEATNDDSNNFEFTVVE